MLAATRTRTLRTIAIATLVASMMLGALLAPQQAEATYYYKYDKVKVYTGPYPFYGYMWATFRWDVTTVYYGQHYRCVNSIRITVTPSQQVGGFVFGPDTEFMARNFYVPNWYPAYYPNSGTKK